MAYWSDSARRDDEELCVLTSSDGLDYFARRALMRARAETKNAPADPTTARMAVGFSGELTQPFCAWSGRATAKSRAEPMSRSVDFFIVSSTTKLLTAKLKVNEKWLKKSGSIWLIRVRDRGGNLRQCGLKVGRRACALPGAKIQRGLSRSGHRDTRHSKDVRGGLTREVPSG
jgi:hypothetical protein